MSGHIHPARKPEPSDAAGDVLTAATVPRPRDVPLGSLGRPSWRGRLHLIALSSAIPLIVLLAIYADGARSRAAVIIFGVGLCSMFAVSTTYHRWVHTVQARAAWRRADHATIFAAIAGTCSAIALTSLSTGRAIAMLVAVWSTAVVGALFKVFSFDRFHALGGVMYIALGWSGMALIPAVWNEGGPVPVGLLVAGGVVYTVGALGFARQWPTLSPLRFSYHEVWHACTVIAAGLHFAAVCILAT